LLRSAAGGNSLRPVRQLCFEKKRIPGSGRPGSGALRDMRALPPKNGSQAANHKEYLLLQDCADAQYGRVRM
jgi:hypothetical protein